MIFRKINLFFILLWLAVATESRLAKSNDDVEPDAADYMPVLEADAPAAQADDEDIDVEAPMKSADVDEGNTCCKTAKCADYRGTIAVTKDGHTCKDWEDSKYKPSNYPDGGLIKNYCRNPRFTERKAWCYTTHGSWDWCDIPQCKDVTLTCCKKDDPKCLKYKGTKSTTSSGKKCQAWNQQSPHSHKVTSSNAPALRSTGDFETNYCRNPNKSGQSNGAWCYTMDKNIRWESCGIPTCSQAKAHCQVGHTYFGGEEKDYRIKQEGQFIGDSVYGQGWTKTITQSFSSFKERPTFVASISSFVQNKESTSDKSLGILIKVKAVTTSNATIEVEAFDKMMERVQVTWFACDNNDDNDNNDDDDN